MEYNGLQIKVVKKYYNKTKLADDGITNIVDIQEDYPLYELEISKNYYNKEKEEILEEIVKDLESVTKELKRTLKKRYEKEQEKLEK